MSTRKALAWSAGITVVSMALLTLAHGLPTLKQAEDNGVAMFVLAFVVLKLIVPAFRGGSNSL